MKKLGGITTPRRVRPMLVALAVTLVFWCFGVGRLAPSAAAREAAPAGDVRTSAPQLSGAAAAVSVPGTGESSHPSGHETIPKVLLVLLLMLVLARIGGDLFSRLGQPAVLGELIFGILLGNLGLFQLGGLETWVDRLVHDRETLTFIMLLSEIGVILLLFEVGLESTVREMVSVGASSLAVAVVGVVCPMALGYGCGRWFLPDEPYTVHLFLGAVLAATSVGITARVLLDLGRTRLREAKIILGAAVLDDILGLVVLAVVQGMAAAAVSGQALSAGAVALISAKAVAFFVAAIVLGMLISPRLFRWATYLQGQGVLLTLTLGWCFLIAWLGTLVGVAPIVGAFAAGLVLEDAAFIDWRGREADLEDLLRPITTFLVPVFFVYTGMNVNLATFARMEILGFAAVLTAVAILGKQVCALAVMERGLNRLAIGIGMVPRGEVGLIVANVGRTMKTPTGEPLISDNTFSAVVIMVVVTTMITPPALKWSLRGTCGGPDDAENTSAPQPAPPSD